MFYRRSGKQFSSECLSSTVMVTAIDGLEGNGTKHCAAIVKDSIV